MENALQFQKDFFANLQLNIIISAYTHCPDTWREIDYVPDYNKLYFISEGEGWLKIGNEEYYPKPGQLFLMPAGVLQSYSVISANTFKKYWCHFTLKVGDINLFDIMDVPCYIDVKEFEKVRFYFEELVKEQENPKLSARLREKALMMEIVSYYIENSNVRELKLNKFSSIEKLSSVLGYIQEHIADEITVELLAGKLHFHPNYFNRVFKKYIGMTPSQYINKVRLERAKLLLKTTDLQITEIADRIGFCDVYHFSKVFKAYSGFTPKDYRIS